MAIDLHDPGPDYLAFWQQRHVCTLTTPRPDGTPHLVPVGATFDPETRIARVIASGPSKKVRNVRAAGPVGARVALCQFAGAHWATLEGVATVDGSAEAVADAEVRYAERYTRTPRPNPRRVVIRIAVDHAMGRV